MKKILVSLVALCATVSVFAQKPFIQTEQGSTYVYKIYDDKDKQAGSYDVDITSMSQKAISITNTVPMGEEVGEMIICEDYTIEPDGALKQARTPRIMFYNPQVTISILWCTKDTPGKMKAGDQWPVEKVAQLQQISYQGQTILILNVESADRKVVAAEKVTVPAGSYDAFKCEVNKKSFAANLKMEGDDVQAFITKVTNILKDSNGDTELIKPLAVEFQEGAVKLNEWHAAGVGLVKAENFDDKGKVVSTTKLYSIE